MPFDFESGIQGAGAGASLGSIFPGPGTAIGAGIGFIGGGLLGGSSKKKARQADAKRFRRIVSVATPDKLLEFMRTLQPKFREALVTGGEADAMQAEIAGNIAKRGWSGTGVGEAMRNAGVIAPSIAAFNAALNEARNQQALLFQGVSGQNASVPFTQGTQSLFGSSSPSQLAQLGAIFKELGNNKTSKSGGPLTQFDLLPGNSTTEM